MKSIHFAALSVAGVLLLSAPMFGAGPEALKLKKTPSAPAVSATQLLDELQESAGNISDLADGISRLEWSSTSDWRAQAQDLGDIREEINAIAPKVEKLNQMRLTLPDTQKQAIARVLPAWVEVVASAQKALKILSDNPQQIFARKDYHDAIEQLSQNSWKAFSTLKEFDEYERTRDRERKIGNTLGLKSAS